MGARAAEMRKLLGLRPEEEGENYSDFPFFPSLNLSPITSASHQLSPSSMSAWETQQGYTAECKQVQTGTCKLLEPCRFSTAPEPTEQWHP